MSQHHHLYNTARWKRLRAEQLRAHPLCRMHGELGQVAAATVADHVKAHRGDEALFFDADNLQSLCKHCHDAHKQAQERNADGVLRGAGLSGQPLDLSHPWHRQTGGGSKPESAARQDRLPLTVRSAAKLEGGAIR